MATQVAVAPVVVVFPAEGQRGLSASIAHGHQFDYGRLSTRWGCGCSLAVTFMAHVKTSRQKRCSVRCSGGRKPSKRKQGVKRRRASAKVELGKWTALREDIQRFMQTILIGATLAGVVSTAFITEICGQLFGPKGLGIATVSVTLVQLTLGEILPKSMAVSSPYNFAEATLPFFYRISTVVYPVSRILNEVGGYRS
eukprot:g6482.t1